MTDREADEVLNFDLPNLSRTIKTLRAMEKKCKEKRGEIIASKQGVNEIRVTCSWNEAFVSEEDVEEFEEEEA